MVAGLGRNHCRDTAQSSMPHAELMQADYGGKYGGKIFRSSEFGPPASMSQISMAYIDGLIVPSVEFCILTDCTWILVVVVHIASNQCLNGRPYE